MVRKASSYVCVALVLCFIASSVVLAADNQSTGEKAKSWWQKLFNYPANVTNESVGVVTNTATRTTNVVTKEVKTVGQVTSGDVNKTKDLVVEPLTGTAETAKKAVEETVAVPTNAAKEEPQAAK